MRYRQLTLIALLLLLYTTRTEAQRINAFTLEGLTSLAPCCSFNPTNNDESSPGDLQIVFPPNSDLTNRVATLEGTFTIDTNPMPTDWSTPQNIQLTNGSNTAWYDITCKVINPSTLPFLMNTSVTNIADAWSTSTVGWAASCIQKERDLVRFGNAYANFIVAFSDAPDSVSYSINFAADSAAEGTVFDVEESANGVTWSSVMQWTEANIPTNLSTDEEKYHAHKLLSSSRYVRWYFSTRTSGTVALTDMLKVTSGEGNASSIQQQSNTQPSEVKLAPIPASSVLRIQANRVVSSVQLCNMLGQVVAIHTPIDALISVSELSAGCYLAIITFEDGTKSVKSFIKR